MLQVFVYSGCCSTLCDRPESNYFTMNGLEETRGSRRCRLCALAERNACVTELSNVHFGYRQAFLFCIV